MFWLTIRKLKLINIDNKLLIYRVIVQPIWTYDIQF